MEIERGICMFLKIVNGYWVLYAMIAVAVAGILSRLALSGIYRSLLKDLKRNGAPRHRLIKQMKKNYESCCQRNEGIRDMDAFISASLYNHRFFGMTIDGLKRVSGQALFLCLVMGGAVLLTGEYIGVSRAVLELYTAVGLVLLAGIMDVTWIGNAGRKQELLEVAVLNYLNNRLPTEAWERSVQEEKAALISELKEKRADGRISAQAETDIKYLKKSLEQIAAEREEGEPDAPYMLTPAEGRLVEEIIEGFLG